MNTQWLKAFSQDLLFSTTAAIVGVIVIGIVVISADLRYFGDKSAVLIPLFVGMPLGAASIPGMRSIERSLLKRLLAFLFAAICASSGIIGIVAAMISLAVGVLFSRRCQQEPSVALHRDS